MEWDCRVLGHNLAHKLPIAASNLLHVMGVIRDSGAEGSSENIFLAQNQVQLGN
jgi:hypothetical protein